MKTANNKKMKTVMVLDKKYGQNFLLIVDCNEQKLHDHIKRSFNIDLGEISGCYGKTVFLEMRKKDDVINLPIVWLGSSNLNEKIDGNSYNEIMAHELFHLFSFNIRKLKFSTTEDAEEPNAFYFGHLFKQLINKITKLNENNKNRIIKRKRIKKVSKRRNQKGN